MTDLFSGDWMLKFMSEWNNEPELADELAKISFNSSIAYGFKSDSDPTGLVVIADGRITSATEYDGEDVNWDLRAAPEDWQSWFEKPPGMMVLGMAYTSRKLKFNKGDYAAMLKDPRMAGPFIKSFAVMGRV